MTTFHFAFSPSPTLTPLTETGRQWLAATFGVDAEIGRPTPVADHLADSTLRQIADAGLSVKGSITVGAA